MKQLAASLADDTFSQSTCNSLVVSMLSEAIRTHPNIGLVTSLLQDVNNLLQTCAFLAVKSYAYIYKLDVAVMMSDVVLTRLIKVLC